MPAAHQAVLTQAQPQPLHWSGPTGRTSQEPAAEAALRRSLSRHAVAGLQGRIEDLYCAPMIPGALQHVRLPTRLQSIAQTQGLLRDLAGSPA